MKFWLFLWSGVITQSCYPTTRLIHYEIGFNYKVNTIQTFNIQTITPGIFHFTFQFWMKYEQLSEDKTGSFLYPLSITNYYKNSGNQLEAKAYLELSIQSQTMGILTFKNDANEFILNNSNNVMGTWIFFAFSQDTPAQKQYLYLGYQNSNVFFDEIEMPQTWTDNEQTKIEIGGRADDQYFFHGQASRADFIQNYMIDEVTQFEKLRQGIPHLVFATDFRDPEMSQNFKNLINNQYPYALNGISDYTDVFDMDYVKGIGWSNRYGQQKITLSKFQEYQAEQVSFAFFIKYQVSSINQDYTSWHSHYYFAMIHRFNYNSSNNIVNKYMLYLHKYDRYKMQIKRNVMNYHYEYFKTIQCYEEVENKVCYDGMVFNSFYKSISNTDYFHMDLILDYDNIRKFSNPTRAITFAFAQNETLCKSNMRIEAGLDEQSQPAQCVNTHDAYPSENKCVKKNVVEIDFCSHDMSAEGGKCYRCPVGFGNKDKGVCQKCYKDCLSCTGPLREDCTYCKMGYGFNGTVCRRCDIRYETFDMISNTCKLHANHFLDLYGEPETVGEIELFFRGLDAWAESEIHIENLLQKYWVSKLARNFYIFRKYENLKRHRKVSIYFELVLIDLIYHDFFMISVDTKYVKIVSEYRRDDQSEGIGELWGLDNSWTRDWHMHIQITLEHSANTLELGIISFHRHIRTNMWVRNIQVDFFGCFETCTDCILDNSPLHCLACQDGYYLVNQECLKCEDKCLTCQLSAENCIEYTPEYLQQNGDVQRCNYGQYFENNQCNDCPNECSQCDSLTVCTSCKPLNYLDSNQCLPCQSPCEQCTSNTQCLTCQGSLFLHNQTCIASCPSQTYTQSQICQDCSSNCDQCSSSICDICDSGFLKQQGKCVSSCEQGFYQDGQNCLQCPDQCQSCNSLNDCQSCSDGYLLQGNQCIQCSNPCLTCQNNLNECTSCVLTFYMHNTECLQECPESFYKYQGQCQPCSTQCKTCENKADQCLTCDVNFYKFKNQCLSECPVNYKPIETLCCLEPCSSCSSENSCDSCIQGYYLDQNQCKLCDSKCSKCEEAVLCTECADDYFFHEGDCVSSCPVNFYKENLQCNQCHESCQGCTGSSNQDCIKCSSEHVNYLNQCTKCDESSPFEWTGLFCRDKCGDGKRFTQELLPDLVQFNACDDGNQINGDGCSADCQVEENFICEGGSPNSPDICQEIIPPEASLKKIDSENFEIIFTEKMIFFDPKAAIKVEIENLEEDKDYEVQFKEIEGGYKIFINYLNTVNENEIFFIFDRNLIKDEKGNKIRNAELVDEVSYWVPPRSQFEKYTNSTLIASQVYFHSFQLASTFIGPLVQQQIITNMWSLDSLISQIYIKSKVDSNYLLMMHGISNLKQHEGRQLLELQLRESYTKINYIDESLNEIQNHQNLFFNELNFFIFLILFILNKSSNFLFFKRISKKSSFWARNGYLMIDRYFLLFSLSQFPNWLRLSLQNFFNIRIQSIESILIGFLSFSFILFGLFQLYNLHRLINQPIETLWHPFYYWKYGYLYSQYKLNKSKTKKFLLFMMILILLKNFFLISLQSSQYQILCLFCVSMTTLALKVSIKPFTSKIFMIISLTHSIFELVSFGLFLTLNFFINSPRISEYLILVNILWILFCYGSILIFLLLMIILRIINRKKLIKPLRKKLTLAKSHQSLEKQPIIEVEKPKIEKITIEETNKIEKLDLDAKKIKNSIPKLNLSFEVDDEDFFMKEK